MDARRSRQRSTSRREYRATSSYRRRSPFQSREPRRRSRSHSSESNRRWRSRSRSRESRRRRSPSSRSFSRDGYRRRRGRRPKRRDKSHSSYRSPNKQRRRGGRDGYDERHPRQSRREDRSQSPWFSGSRSRSSSRERSRRTRRHHRRRSRRRSPTSPSTPRHEGAAQPRQHAGVVSDDEDGANRQNPQHGNEKHVQEKRAAASSSPPRDDSTGHFEGPPGTMITSRYKVLRDVGLGTFGRVVECADLKRSRRSGNNRRGQDNNGPRVAIKVVRNVKRYYDSALIEADIVEGVNRRGGRGTALCAILLDSFTWKSHYCLVFESLGLSLYDFMKRYDYQPFPMVCVRDFTMQLLEALEFLHSFGLIHTDLKPENILLCSSGVVNYTYHGRTYRVPESTRIKLIDFGGSVYNNDKKKSSIVNTRQYRAPEVILGVGWSMPSDVWSLGCILAELYIGELLFATHDNVEHLALIEKCIGPFPRRMLNHSTSKLVSDSFDSNGRHRLDRVLPSENASYVRKALPLEARIRNEDGRFLQMLRRILVIDPNARMPAHECVRYRL